MGRKGLLIVMMLLIVSLSLVVSSETASANTCVVATNTNCLDVNCSIVVATNGNPIYATEYNGTHYIRSTTPLRNSQYNFTVRSTTDLQGLSATCEMPEFNTKYCTYRGLWATNVIVERRYMPSTSIDREIFTLNQMSAFDCRDWIPPRVLVLDERPNYETGAREIRFIVTDDERYIAENDNTNITFCAYRERDPGAALPTTQLTLTAGNPPDGWTKLDECNNVMATNPSINRSQSNSSKDFIVYAIDSANNFAYHRVPGSPLYPSLPSGASTGFCPRANECFVNANGNVEVNTFEGIHSGENIIPVCVMPGSTLNDVYCDATRGLMSKTERIYELARSEANGFSNANITIYCSDLSRISTLQSESFPNKCSFATETSEANCVNSCTLYVQAPGGRNAFLYTSMNRPTVLSLPGILSTSITQGASCRTFTAPYTYFTCPHNFRTQSLSSYYYQNQSLLHITTQSSAPLRNLTLTAQFHNEALITQLRDAISQYFRHNRTEGNGELNRSVFEGKNGAYEYIAYRRNGDKTALAMRININSVPQENEVFNNPIIVAAIYHNYDGNQISSYARSQISATIYPLRIIQVNRNGAYTVVLGSVSNDVDAARAIEQLVVRIRPGGLS